MMKLPSKKNWDIKKFIIHALLINLGTLLLAIGVYFFKSPNHFATGGVSGLSILLAKLDTPITQAYWMLIINTLLLIVGFLFLGKGCTIKTIYCSLVYSGETLLFEYIFPLEAPLTDQPLLELVYAILLTGVGSAILFNCGASSGGTDIVALILKKFTSLNTGRALLVSDVLIALSTFFVFGIQAGLYSILGLFAKAFLVDGVIESVGKSKYMTIITTNPEPIGEFIIKDMNRSYTKYEATGGYSGENKEILLIVCKRGEALRLKRKVKELDPTAFTIITDANEILGKGFRQT
jgi:uncharacterized membrane-anchored protein YitT (DUF2179 family)